MKVLTLTLVLLLNVVPLKLRGQIKLKFNRDSSILKKQHSVNRVSELYFYRDSIYLRGSKINRQNTGSYSICTEDSTLKSCRHAIRPKDFPIHIGHKKLFKKISAKVVTNSEKGIQIDTVRIELEKGELLFRMDSIRRSNKRSINFSEIELPIDGNLTLENNLVSNPILSNGQNQTLTSRLSLNLSAKELGIPIKASFIFSDYPYAQRFAYNISIDTSSIPKDTLNNLGNKTFNQYKDSSLKETYNYESELNQLKKEKHDILNSNQIDTSNRYNSEFISSEQDSINAMEYSSYDYSSDTSINKSDLKRLEEIDSRISSLDQLIAKNKSTFSNDSLSQTEYNKYQGKSDTLNQYNQRMKDVQNTDYNSFDISNWQELNFIQSIDVLEIGNIFPNYSPLTISNYPLQGVQAGFSVFKKKVSFKGYYGNKTTAFYNPGNENSFGFMLKLNPFKDTEISVSNIYNTLKINSLESIQTTTTNSLFSINVQQDFTEYFQLNGEVAFSGLYHENERKYKFPELLNGDDNIAYMLKGTIKPHNSSVITISFTETQNNYTTLSSPYLRPATTSYEIQLKQRLGKIFKTKLGYLHSVRSENQLFESLRHHVYGTVSSSFKHLPNIIGRISVNEVNYLNKENLVGRNNKMTMINTSLGLTHKWKIRKVRYRITGMGLYNQQASSQLIAPIENYSGNILFNVLSKKFDLNTNYLLNLNHKTYHTASLNTGLRIKKIYRIFYEGSVSTGNQLSTISRSYLGVSGTLNKLNIRFNIKLGGVTVDDQFSFAGRSVISYMF